MKIHELKSWPQFFGPVLDGTKRFEIRSDDRGFKAGDTLLLREYEPYGVYTGRTLTASVDFVMRRWPEIGLKDGYCIMSITVKEDKP